MLRIAHHFDDALHDKIDEMQRCEDKIRKKLISNANIALWDIKNVCFYLLATTVFGLGVYCLLDITYSITIFVHRSHGVVALHSYKFHEY